ncbi:hypothetical protein CYFUS_001029 [Cystobacter fuscus]|uniref:Uncharacterized protein n=1 Tax=Cystobacter fuscus TaxID=43 RepID=A0A250IV36_9BACT|nr:hypothetical protein CYFUS_001029 [Cystobacter fuscus]
MTAVTTQALAGHSATWFNSRASFFLAALRCVGHLGRHVPQESDTPSTGPAHRSADVEDCGLLWRHCLKYLE